jgi:poly(beta-D-mannuronate) lyase
VRKNDNKTLNAKSAKKSQRSQSCSSLRVLGVSLASSAFHFYIFLLSILLANNLTFSADYKVTTTEEIKAALKQAKPGDNIVLADGKWTDAKIVFEAKGTKENPITLRAETPGNVIIDGASNLRIAGKYLVVDGLYFKGGTSPDGAVIEFRNGTRKVANFSRLTNTIVEDYNPTDKNTDYKWVSLYGQHNRVDHCYFRNKTHAGCLLVVWLSDEPNYHLIDSNYFAFRPDLGFNGGEIIRVGTSDWSMSDSYTTVEYNYFEECNGEREIISNKSCFNTYRFNTFVASQGALTLRHGNNCRVEGNFFFGRNIPMTGGVRVIGENHTVVNNYFADLQGRGAFSAISMMNGVHNSPLNRYFQVKNALVAFNTLINNKTSIEIGVGADNELSLPPMNSVFANNIVVSKNSPLVKLTSNPINFTWEGNIFYGAEAGIEPQKGIVVKDPLLKIGSDSLWRPSDKSYAIGNAVGRYDSIMIDIDGQQRNGKKDIGCDQILNTKINNRPLKPEDVGPLWIENKRKIIK